MKLIIGFVFCQGPAVSFNSTVFRSLARDFYSSSKPCALLLSRTFARLVVLASHRQFSLHTS